MMKIQLNVNEQLLAKALKLSKLKSNKSLVDLALKNLVKTISRKQILELKGKVKWEGNLLEMRSH